MVTTRRQRAAERALAAKENDVDDEHVSTLTSSKSDDNETSSSAQHEHAHSTQRKKRSGIADFWTRALSGLLMSAAFVAVIVGGHIWVAIAIILMEVSVLFFEGVSAQSICAM